MVDREWSLLKSYDFTSNYQRVEKYGKGYISCCHADGDSTEQPATLLPVKRAEELARDTFMLKAEQPTCQNPPPVMGVDRQPGV